MFLDSQESTDSNMNVESQKQKSILVFFRSILCSTIRQTMLDSVKEVGQTMLDSVTELQTGQEFRPESDPSLDLI